MKRRKVLIADDNPQARDALKALLTTWPELEIVGEAADGLEAVRLVEAVQPDVVLMDIHMPGMDGLDATRLIKDRWPGCKVIALTIHSHHRTGALDAGADAFLIKGCPPEGLLQVILSR